MDLRINAFIVFVFLGTVSSVAQDPAQKPKTIQKVSGADLKASSVANEPKAQSREEKSIHSCEIKKNEAVVTRKNPDGTLSTEKLTIQDKK